MDAGAGEQQRSLECCDVGRGEATGVDVGEQAAVVDRGSDLALDPCEQIVEEPASLESRRFREIVPRRDRRTTETQHVVVGGAEEQGGEVAESIDRFGRVDALDVGEERPAVLRDRLGDQSVLPGEVVMDRRRTHADPAGDVADAESGDTACADEERRLVEHLAADVASTGSSHAEESIGL